MPIVRNQESVPATFPARGVRRQRLLDESIIGSDKIRLDRLAFEPGAAWEAAVPAGGLAWLQVLEGAARVAGPGGERALNDVQAAMLPPGFRGAVRAEGEMTLLWAEVPGAARFDPAFASSPPAFRCVDWSAEPVLNSQHDTRKRIYLVSPKLFGTKAIKGEMIIYPPGGRGSNHHHEEAEHFRYVYRGKGILFSNGEPIELRAGDAVYHFSYERHYALNEGSEDFVFAEFFVPAEHVTVWADGTRVCTWLPTGKNIRGEKPVREIQAHSSALFESPEDV